MGTLLMWLLTTRQRCTHPS